MFELDVGDSRLFLETDEAGSEYLFGSQIERCLLCADYKPNFGPTEEHIFPRTFFKIHPLLAPMKDADENRVYLCRKHHVNVDLSKDGKIQRFHKYGMEGLIRYVAAYPRAINPYLLELQYNQWKQLFGMAKVRIGSLNGDTPKELKSEYQKAGELIEDFLYVWQRGDFLPIVPKKFLALEMLRKAW